MLWVQTLLHEIQVPLACSSVNYDNYITVAMAQHPVLHARTKDMEVDLFFVRERFLPSSLNWCISLGLIQ